MLKEPRVKRGWSTILENHDISFWYGLYIEYLTDVSNPRKALLSWA